MAVRRDRIEIICDSIRKCSNNGGLLKTELMRRVGFSTEQMNAYLPKMLKSQILEERKNKDGKTCYASSKKGLEVLHVYNKIEALLN